MESGGRFCVEEFGRNQASVTNIFSHLIYFIKKFNKFCTFNVIYKDTLPINCVTAQYKKFHCC
jgi:hypothetical protein